MEAVVFAYIVVVDSLRQSGDNSLETHVGFLLGRVDGWSRGFEVECSARGSGGDIIAEEVRRGRERTFIELSSTKCSPMPWSPRQSSDLSHLLGDEALSLDSSP